MASIVKVGKLQKQVVNLAGSSESDGFKCHLPNATLWSKNAVEASIHLCMSCWYTSYVLLCPFVTESPISLVTL